MRTFFIHFIILCDSRSDVAKATCFLDASCPSAKADGNRFPWLSYSLAPRNVSRDFRFLNPLNRNTQQLDLHLSHFPHVLTGPCCIRPSACFPQVDNSPTTRTPVRGSTTIAPGCYPVAKMVTTLTTPKRVE